MTEPHVSEVQRLFEELVELGPAERAERLAALGAEQPDLYGELASLLQAADRVGDFLGVLGAEHESASSGHLSADAGGRLASVVAGRYEIQRRLGRGAYGEVYLARDRELDRLVALKFLNTEWGADAAAGARFLAEARAAARLSNPHVAAVYDIARDDRGRPFIAMVYYPGDTLRERIARGPLTPADAALIARQIADGLVAAHDAGIVHRDIKPANVLFDASGTAKIADFGIAKLPGHAVTSPGALVGTLAYMAPEQVNGDPVTSAADLWALGVVLYEMVTGRRPFTGAGTGELIRAILACNPSPLTAPPRESGASAVQNEGSRLLGQLQVLVDRLLAKNPEDRPSAREVCDHLTPTPLGVGLPAAPRRSGWRPRWRVLPIGVTAAILVAAAAVGLGMRFRHRTGTSDLDAARVVVAPFENRTHDPALDEVGVLATDWVTQGLTETGLLRVVDPRRAAQLAQALAAPTGRPDAGSALARATRAATVVSGRYYAVGDSIQFQVDILDGRSGDVRHAVRALRAPRGEPTAALEGLRQGVLGALAIDVDPHLRGWSERTTHTPLYAAYVENVAGLEALWQPDDAAPMNALEHFRRAAEIDTGYLKPRLFATRTLLILGRTRAADSSLHSIAPRRPELDPLDAAYYDRLAADLTGDPGGGLRAARKIYALAPGPQSAWVLAGSALAAGRVGEAVAALRSVDLTESPEMSTTPVYFGLLATCYHMLGQHERELRVAENLHSQFPEMVSAFESELRALAAMGRMKAIGERLAEAERAPADATSRATVGGLMTTAAEELLVHGHEGDGAALAARAAAWCTALQPWQRDQFIVRVQCTRTFEVAGALQQGRGLALALVSEFPDTIRFRGELAVMAARLGDRDVARREDAAILRTHSADTLADVPFVRARIAAAMGDSARAIALLSDAQAHGMLVPAMAHGDPAFTLLRGYAPYESLASAQR